jgi:hypothetical protein
LVISGVSAARYGSRPSDWQYSQVDSLAAGEQLICSARGCRARAVHALRWNNPKLHTPDRRKTWLACDAHLPTLTQFLDARGFLREVESLA